MREMSARESRLSLHIMAGLFGAPSARKGYDADVREFTL